MSFAPSRARRVLAPRVVPPKAFDPICCAWAAIDRRTAAPNNCARLGAADPGRFGGGPPSDRAGTDPGP